jgi:hypothetical protein
MGAEAMQHDQGSGTRFERDEVLIGAMTLIGVKPVHAGAALRPAAKARAQAAAVAAGLSPYAAIVDRGILKREPEAQNAVGFGIKPCRILVGIDLTARQRLFEDHHRLEQKGIGHADLPADPGQPGIAGKSIEHRVKVVQSVTDLVDTSPARLRRAG